MDNSEEFKNQEENLRAIISCQQPQFSIPKVSEKKKKKDPQEEKATNFKLHKKFKECDFTPLNVAITKVLMEIKKNPDHTHALKIWKNPSERTKYKYCAFHALRLLIEKFIRNEKLVRFLAE